MEKSQELGELFQAVSKFQGKMKAVGFDSNNPFFKSKYASLSALVSTAAPLVAECGLCVVQLTCDDGAVETVLGHTSGQFISSKLKLRPTKEDPQGAGSAITYSRRYAYASILGLVSDEDDDGNAAASGSQAKITNEQLHALRDSLIDIGEEAHESKVASFCGVNSLEDLPATSYLKAVAAIAARKVQKKAGGK